MSRTVKVPSTKMGGRYLAVHAKAETGKPWRMGERTKRQLELARRDASESGSRKLAKDFLDSIREFGLYEPREEPFHPERKTDRLKQYRRSVDKDGNPSTSRLAAAIEEEDGKGKALGVKTGTGLPKLTYVDRELVPSRTTSPLRFPKDPRGTRIRLDLLFATGRKPVIAEVKARGDENAYYALIQALAICAQLAPERQRQRLSREYPALSEDGPLELWIVLYDHNSNGKEKAEMVDLARIIAGRLMNDGKVPRYLGAIRCVEAELPESGPVTMKEGKLGWSVPAKG